ncbi:MAG: 2-C-methyl-D-erythritol 4-phosphate cytidylyltransferase [Candidatus Eremiobacteraeota bacterium]|nr:2-C-methyl-D-erythritol 4-phosphate cytidylyltransferase [Candidatus Eremiobacteraeota bacterium]
MRWAAIVAAAGHGLRFGRPKQLVDLAGAPMLSWPLRTLANMSEIADIVIVTEAEWTEQVLAIAAAAITGKPFSVVAGGATRQASVRAGLDALPEQTEAVLVHDGARPLVRASDVRAGMAAVRDGRASLLAIPVVDTIKVIDSNKLTVTRTLDREPLWAAQTPQFAMMRDLHRAHMEALRAGVTASDDATLLERLGLDVEIVEGSVDNFKVTVHDDLVRAELLLRARIERLPSETEIMLVEVFIDETLVKAVCAEIDARGGTVDGIDRDLPNGVAIRAYVASDRMAGFGERFEAITSGIATFTARFSHYAERSAQQTPAGGRL